MPFNSESFINLLPSYLTASEKERLKESLKQFKIEEQKKIVWNPKIYTDFYLNKKKDFFLQGDLVKEMRFAEWDKDKRSYEKKYINSIILSNTCDIYITNQRIIPKQVLLAPIIPFDEFLQELKATQAYNQQKIKEIEQSVKDQLYSNVFYLPPIDNAGSKGYICSLDEIFWIPSEEFQTYLTEINENRITSLDHFGFYLFILKVSYHFCRLPEEEDRY
jgi:hypothetical protein